jgi:S-phase kinase-associated protein 1
MSLVKLQSSDGVQIDVEIEIIKCSQTIKTMLDDLGWEGDEEAIPLPNVNSNILNKVVEWAIHHKVKNKINLLLSIKFELKILVKQG